MALISRIATQSLIAALWLIVKSLLRKALVVIGLAVELWGYYKEAITSVKHAISNASVRPINSNGYD